MLRHTYDGIVTQEKILGNLRCKSKVLLLLEQMGLYDNLEFKNYFQLTKNSPRNNLKEKLTDLC